MLRGINPPGASLRSHFSASSALMLKLLQITQQLRLTFDPRVRAAQMRSPSLCVSAFYLQSEDIFADPSYQLFGFRPQV